MWSLTVEQEEKIGCYRDSFKYPAAMACWADGNLGFSRCYNCRAQWQPSWGGWMASRKRCRVCRGAAFTALCKRKLSLQRLCKAVGRNISLTSCMFLKWAFLLMAQGERRRL